MEEKGVEVEVIQYTKTRPDEKEFARLVKMSIDPPSDMVRRDKFFQTNELSESDVDTPEKVVEVLAKFPRLLQRPFIVIDNKRGFIGRPKDRISEYI